VWIVAKEARAPEPKRQHYAPRFYLKGFVGEKDRLFVINRPPAPIKIEELTHVRPTRQKL
jgi:hypothetical protein